MNKTKRWKIDQLAVKLAKNGNRRQAGNFVQPETTYAPTPERAQGLAHAAASPLSRICLNHAYNPTCCLAPFLIVLECRIFIHAHLCVNVCTVIWCIPVMSAFEIYPNREQRDGSKHCIWVGSTRRCLTGLQHNGTLLVLNQILMLMRPRFSCIDRTLHKISQNLHF